nr:MAG TPA_asm: hypothetical protein [Caudoviricetes sp.]
MIKLFYFFKLHLYFYSSPHSLLYSIGTFFFLIYFKS